jgi:hypothetical protein
VTITCSKNKVLQGITRFRLYVCILKFKNKNMKKTSILFAFLMSSLFAIAQQKDIVDIAIASKDHTTLVAAVKAADLVGTLKGAGPFTVFAPTNAAFDKLPAGTVASLLKPEAKGYLIGYPYLPCSGRQCRCRRCIESNKSGKRQSRIYDRKWCHLNSDLEREKCRINRC